MGVCGRCHRQRIKDYQRRASIQPGGKSCPASEECPRRAECGLTPEFLRACQELFNRCERSLHCKGVGIYALDDGHPWQEVALRCWEEQEPRR